MTGPNTIRVRSIHAPCVPSNSDGCPNHFESRATTEVTQKENKMAMRLTASVLLLCRLCARPQVRAPAPARARRRRWPPLTAEAGRGGRSSWLRFFCVNTGTYVADTGNLVTNSGACVAVRRTLVVMVEVSWTVLTFSPRNSRSAQRIIQILEACSLRCAERSLILSLCEQHSADCDMRGLILVSLPVVAVVFSPIGHHDESEEEEDSRRRVVSELTDAQILQSWSALHAPFTRASSASAGLVPAMSAPLLQVPDLRCTPTTGCTGSCVCTPLPKVEPLSGSTSTLRDQMTGCLPPRKVNSSSGRTSWLGDVPTNPKTPEPTSRGSCCPLCRCVGHCTSRCGPAETGTAGWYAGPS